MFFAGGRREQLGHVGRIHRACSPAMLDRVARRSRWPGRRPPPRLRSGCVLTSRHTDTRAQTESAGGVGREDRKWRRAAWYRRREMVVRVIGARGGCGAADGLAEEEIDDSPDTTSRPARQPKPGEIGSGKRPLPKLPATRRRPGAPGAARSSESMRSSTPMPPRVWPESFCADLALDQRLGQVADHAGCADEDAEHGPSAPGPKWQRPSRALRARAMPRRRIRRARLPRLPTSCPG